MRLVIGNKYRIAPVKRGLTRHCFKPNEVVILKYIYSKNSAELQRLNSYLTQVVNIEDIVEYNNNHISNIVKQ